jgi:hypothetical protein
VDSLDNCLKATCLPEKIQRDRCYAQRVRKQMSLDLSIAVRSLKMNDRRKLEGKLSPIFKIPFPNCQSIYMYNKGVFSHAKS